jgi:hypothetical protein
MTSSKSGVDGVRWKHRGYAAGGGRLAPYCSRSLRKSLWWMSGESERTGGPSTGRYHVGGWRIWIRFPVGDSSWSCSVSVSGGVDNGEMDSSNSVITSHGAERYRRLT